MQKTEFDDLPWAEIKEISESGLFEEVFKKIPKNSFRFAAEKENHEVLVNSAFKSLKKSDPEASYAQAEVLAGLMQAFAQKILKR